MNNKKTLYVATNMYLSQIQRGIQSLHVAVDMSLTNHPDYRPWAEDGKTVVVLNGGNSYNLETLFNELVTYNAVYPNHSKCVVKFHEDAQSLNGALTAVGVIVDQKTIDATTYPLDYEQQEKEPLHFSNFVDTFLPWRHLRLA